MALGDCRTPAITVRAVPGAARPNTARNLIGLQNPAAREQRRVPALWVMNIAQRKN